MKKYIIILSVLAALQLSSSLQSQDIRTVETRVADLLARLPADNQDLTRKLMQEMFVLGEEGRSLICSKVVPAGTGDDTKARYAISSLTFHLSGDDKPDRKIEWERQCIGFMKEASHEEVKTFFLRQLNLIGSAAATEALVDFVRDSVLCDDAVIALQFIGSDEAVRIIASGLASDVSPCAAQIMVALADRKYTGALQDYIRWYENGAQAEKSAALYGLAATADPAALPVLNRAAESAGYAWEPTGAVQALLLYAKNIGLAGDVRGMDRIIRQVTERSTSSEASGQRLAAMSVTVAVKGQDALPMLLEAADDPDIVIRSGALRLTNSFTGPDVTKRWIKRVDKVHDEAKAEILFMLGERGDELAVPLMKETLGSPSKDLAREAATALAKLQGPMAVDPLIDWILKTDNEDGHMAAANALTTVLDSTSIKSVAARLPQSSGHSTVTLIWLLAWSGNDEYFPTVMSYVNSPDPGIRAAAITSLARLSGCDDQAALITLLETIADKPEIAEVQRALVAAALQCPDPQKRSDVILESFARSNIKLRLVPVLSQTGGEAAVKTVLKEFEAGNAETRDICFDALAHWSDHTALSALYEIAASGNKTFSRPSFDAYLRSLRTAELSPELKLQLIKDIAPLALAPDARAEIILLAGTLNTRQAALYISSYSTDDSEEVRRTAEETIDSMKLPENELSVLTYEVYNKLTPEEEASGFSTLFNGLNLDGWVGDKNSYVVEDGVIVIRPGGGSGGNLYTEKEYSDFIFRFEFQLSPGANNGLGIRAPLQGDAAYVGIELQILDNTAAEYADLKPYQFHGSVYGVIPAKRGYLKPVGEWNSQEVTIKGTQVRVILNGTVILDGDYAEALENGTADGANHPGLKNKSGHIGFLGHGSVVRFRNIRIKSL